MEQLVQAAANPMQVAQQAFDIDMVQEVHNLLCRAGMHKKSQEVFLAHPWIKEAQTFVTEGQRFLLNRYWKLQLCQLPTDTSAERWCLVENGTIAEWLSLFEKKIIPFCLDNDLPRPFGAQ